MDISRTYSANGYAFIINLLCLVKFFTECMFLGEPQCYKNKLFMRRPFTLLTEVTFKMKVSHINKSRVILERKTNIADP